MNKSKEFKEFKESFKSQWSRANMLTCLFPPNELISWNSSCSRFHCLAVGLQLIFLVADADWHLQKERHMRHHRTHNDGPSLSANNLHGSYNTKYTAPPDLPHEQTHPMRDQTPHIMAYVSYITQLITNHRVDTIQHAHQHLEPFHSS